MQQNSKKHIIAASIGNTLEWYDFAIYGYFAVVIGELFFPSANKELATISAFAAFASGYLARPIGALIFGHIGDKIGRKKSLVASVGIMAISTISIALLPTYEHIGIYAPILLVFFRIISGISVGGEYIASAVYVLESTTNNKNFNVSLIIVGATAGFLLGSVVSISLDSLLSAELKYLSWRIAFLLGVLIAIIGVFIRKHMPELLPDKDNDIKIPIITIIKNYKVKLLQNITINLLSATTFYLLFVYAISWLIKTIHVQESVVLDINLYALITLAIFVLLGGYLTNKFPKKNIAITLAVALTISVYPLFWLIGHTNFIYEFIGEIAISMLLGAILPSLLILQLENFNSNVRATGGSLAYNLSFGLFGGTAPLVASWLLLETSDSLSFVYYIILAGIITCLALLTIKEKKYKPKL